MKLHFRSFGQHRTECCALAGLCGLRRRPKAATTITVWTYYSGDQLTSFNELVDEFNSTVGQEKHIVVKSSSQGSVTDLETNVLAAAKGEVGAAALPNIYPAMRIWPFTTSTSSARSWIWPPYLTDKGKGRLRGRLFKKKAT